MKRIKVLHLITHLGVGGALDNTLLTVEQLSRDRYEVDLAAGNIPKEENYTSWERRSRASADQLFFVPELQRQVHPIKDMQACRRLMDVIRQRGYQVVHTHCAKAGVLGRIAAQRAGVPVIVHTCHAFGSQVTRVPQGSRLRGFANQAKEKLFILAERHTGNMSDKLITVCEQNRQQAIDQRLAPADKIETIYSGIDLERFNICGDRQAVFQSLELDPARPLVALIGRLAAQKAPLDFVEAAKQVLPRRPDTQFVIAGDGPLADQVLKAIRDEPRIKCIGFLEEVPELLSVLDVLAVSSLWEGLGRSVTEAMIMGVPVAATAVDGIPELIEHERTGLLSPSSDPATLADNITRLLDRPDEAQEMADRARKRVRSDFGAERMVQRIDDLYQRLLLEKGMLPTGDFCLEVSEIQQLEGTTHA